MAQSFTNVKDPLDAIDALEDAIDEIDQALPTVIEDHDLASPKKTSGMQLQNGQEGVENPNQSSSKRFSMSTPSRSSNPGYARNGSQTSSRKTSQSSVSPSTTTVKGPGRRLSAGSHQSEKSVKLSVHKPGYVPQKSNKPPTRSTFELPGEAISRRKRAEIEERRRKEEEELQKRREFKARPVGFNPGRPAEVRETAASRIRANRMSQVIEPRPSAPVTPGRNCSTPTSMGGMSSSTPFLQRASSVRTPTVSRNNQAQNTPARSTIVSPGAKKETGMHTALGKEVFRRDRAQADERRQKEEAAKKARAEAAERSRQLSRAWAERQQKKATSNTQA